MLAENAPTARHPIPRAKKVLKRAIALAAAAGTFFAAGIVSAQQASLSLDDSNATVCHRATADWRLEKTGTLDGTTATFTINVIKGPTDGSELVVDGFVSVRNGGSADATLGNVVVNLQRRVGNKWVSAAADVANAASGDLATAAYIVAKATQESAATNASSGPGNYTVSGDIGRFVEGPGSGALEFMDATSNTVFSLSPQKVIAPGAAVDLLFSAVFDDALLAIPVGSPLRAEVLVSFGNAGARGGSGSSLPNVDISGDGIVGPDEAFVRTVVTRLSVQVPPEETCIQTVTLTDEAEDLAATGTVTFTGWSTDIGDGSGTEAVTESVVRTVTVVGVEPGTDGGWLTNTAHLDGVSGYSMLEGRVDRVTGLPTYQYSFECCRGIDLDASYSIPLTAEATNEYCTYTQELWSTSGSAAYLLLNGGCFDMIYPDVVEVGTPGTSGYSMCFTTSAAVCSYLPQTGMPLGQLNADLIDPTSSSSRKFGGEVLTLRLNVDFCDAAMLGNNTTEFGDLILVTPRIAMTNGKCVRDALALFERVLGGEVIPGLGPEDCTFLAGRLNSSFLECTPSAWAQTSLRMPDE